MEQSKLKIALVHDYLKEYGGAERVLEALTEIYPEAPIYTAFCVKDSPAGKVFAGKKIITSWGNRFLPWKNLYSPLRFLTPLIWESFDFSDYDLVISSASWYITKSIITKPETLHLCYCHTPPRWLYGFETARDWKKSLPVKVYGEIMAHFLRQYDYLAAQRVDYFIANSQNTAQRIKKFYRRDSRVIYPPVELIKSERAKEYKSKKEEYFLTGGRLERAKNFDLIVKACNQLKLPLKIYGAGSQVDYLKSIAGSTIEFVGNIDDVKRQELMGNCKAFIVAATDEDFGITPVEAMATGRPVIAYQGGGYLETVIEGETGTFFDQPTVESLTEKLKNIKTNKFNPEDCRKQAEKFGKAVFKQKMMEFVDSKIK